jgi:hypothetical protein
MVKLKVGQMWRSRDPRENRSVVIRGFEGDKVLVQRVEEEAAASKTKAHKRQTANGVISVKSAVRKPVTTKVARERFNTNKSRGYELERDVS